MFEKEIKFISDFTINKINYLGSFFTYDELFNSDINPAILKFVSAEVDYKIYEDRKKLLNQSSFNYSGSEIARYFNLISKEIKKSTKISYNDIKDIINQAVAFNIDYTIIPNESLINLFFDKKQEIKSEDLKLKLNYIYYYPHIKDILSSYLDKKKISVLSASAVKIILSEINNQIFLEAPESAVENAINTISDFYNIGNTGNEKLSIKLVEIYLEKNHLEKYLNKITENVLQESKQKYDVKEIKSILFSSAPVRLPDKKIDEEPDQKVELAALNESTGETIEEKKDNEELQEESLTKSGIPDEEAEDSDRKEIEFDITEHENLDALYNFNEERPEENIEVKDDDTIRLDKAKIQEELKISEKEEENAAIVEKEDEGILDQSKLLKDNDKILEQDREFQKEELSRKIRSKDIFSYLSDKEIERIVGNVFNDDRDDFASTMERISDSESYEEATEILKVF